MFNFKYMALCMLLPLASSMFPKDNSINVPSPEITVPQASTLVEQMVSAPAQGEAPSVGKTVLEERVTTLEQEVAAMKVILAGKLGSSSSSGGSTGSVKASSVPQAQTFGSAVVFGGSTGSVRYRANSTYVAPTVVSTPEIILNPGEVLVGDPVVSETVYSTPAVGVTRYSTSSRCYQDPITGRTICDESVSGSYRQPLLQLPRLRRFR